MRTRLANFSARAPSAVATAANKASGNRKAATISRKMATAAMPPATTDAPAAGAVAAASLPGAASSPQASLQTTVWTVGGEPTEVLELRASTSRPAVHLLVIPGNPGAARFYTPFMYALHRQLGGRAAVTAVSNLGMDGQGLTPRGRVFSLEEQIQHKVALLGEHFAGPGRPPVVVLAHSIGVYMAIHSVHRLERHHTASSRAAAAALDAVAAREVDHPDAAGASLEGMRSELEAERRHQQAEADAAAEAAAGRKQDGGGLQPAGPGEEAGSPSSSGGGPAASSSVVKIVGLYPFLTVDPDCSRQRQLQRITPHHALLSRLAGGLLGPLPLGVRRGLVRLFSSGMDAHAVDCAARVFANPASVENSLFMGMTEFEALAAPADWWLLKGLGRRFALFAAPSDIWFKRWKWDAMHKEVPGVEAHWVETQTHAFCVSEQQSEELASRIAPIVEASLATARL